MPWTNNGNARHKHGRRNGCARLVSPGASKTVHGRPCRLQSVKKQRICWTRYAQNSSRRKKKRYLSLCSELGGKAVLGAAIMKFTVRGLSRRRGWIERVCSSFSNLSGATSARAVTTVHCSFPRPSTPARSARNASRPRPTTKNGSARHRRGFRSALLL